MELSLLNHPDFECNPELHSIIKFFSYSFDVTHGYMLLRGSLI